MKRELVHIGTESLDIGAIIQRVRFNARELTVGNPDLSGSAMTRPWPTDLCDYSILDCVKQDEKDCILAEVEKDPRGDRAIGCMVGMAVGDSVGAPLEFLPVVDQYDPDKFSFDDKGRLVDVWGRPVASPSAFSLTNLKYSNALNEFKLKSGQWTDDTSMGLCIADSLLICGDYHGSDIRVRFWNWWNRSYNNAFRYDKNRASVKSVGLGGNISKSLEYMRHGEIPAPRYEAETKDSGNGSLMRLAAIPIWCRSDLEAACKYARESSYTTHPGHIAAEACAFLAYAAVKAISSTSAHDNAQTFLDECVAKYITLLDEEANALEGQDVVRKLLQSNEADDSLERNWNWKADSLDIEGTLARRGRTYNDHVLYAEYFGSYCMDGLAMALWSVYHTDSFNDAIERCVNFCGDADTTAAIAGQLAGAIYGYSKIDRRLIDNLKVWDHGDIATRGALLYAMSRGEASATS